MAEAKMYDTFGFLNSLYWVVTGTFLQGFQLWLGFVPDDVAAQAISTIIYITAFFANVWITSIWITLDASLLRFSGTFMKSAAQLYNLQSAAMWNLGNKVFLNSLFWIVGMLNAAPREGTDFFGRQITKLVPSFSAPFVWVFLFLTAYRIWIYWLMLAEAGNINTVRAAATWIVSRAFMIAPLAGLWLLAR